MKIHFVEICFDSFQAKESLRGAKMNPNPPPKIPFFKKCHFTSRETVGRKVWDVDQDVTGQICIYIPVRTCTN